MLSDTNWREGFHFRKKSFLGCLRTIDIILSIFPGSQLKGSIRIVDTILSIFIVDIYFR